jgi:hypothetical protein
VATAVILDIGLDVLEEDPEAEGRRRSRWGDEGRFVVDIRRWCARPLSLSTRIAAAVTVA